ncbi:MAG TPA: XRE family transcriptional regulator [Saprospiraceae bacterium]|nr:XRE family transcriptional regulator [Saprospiraceae bacterium]
MTFNTFKTEFGLLIRTAREIKGYHLDDLGFESDIVYDNIQKIETATYGGFQILTYAKLLKGLDVGLSFEPRDKQKDNVYISPEMKNFLNTLFLKLPADPDFQFLNHNGAKLLQKLGDEVRILRNKTGLSQKELAKRVQMSNTTLSRIESGHYDFRLETLYHLSQFLLEKEN